MKNHLSILLGTALAFASLCPATTLKVWIESAPSPSGPWTRVDIDQSALNASGQMVLPPSTSNAGFFRTAIDVDPTDAPAAIIPGAQIPTSVLAIGQQHLEECRNTTDSRGTPLPSPWTDASITEARPVYDAGIDGGQLPAFMELKVARNVPISASTPVGPERDAGYILVSLTTAERPVVCFAMEGRTPLEQLEFATGRRPAKVYRYGPGYYAGEDEHGQLLQGLGTFPLRFDMGAMATIDTTFGSSYAGSDVAFNPQPDPPGLPVVTNFSDYADLKSWWQTSPMLKQARQRRAGFAQIHWDLSAGRMPDLVSLQIGETKALVDSSFRLASYRVDAETGADAFARVVSGGSGGGAAVTGVTVGSAPVYLIDDQDRVKLIVVVVNVAPVFSPKFNGPLLAPSGFKPGWQPIQEWPVLDWSAQPRWKQFKKASYCAVGDGWVGCGPMAWTILLGWFEHQGVPAALGQPLPVDTVLSVNNPVVNDTASELHVDCDTHCVPFTNEGATFPWDMDGALVLVDALKQSGLVNWSATSQWETFPDCFNASAKTAVNALKAHRPAIIGLWGKMHYAVAYNYWQQLFQLVPNGPAYMAQRWFVCNMGFGDNHGELYPADDIFYGMNFSITTK